MARLAHCTLYTLYPPYCAIFTILSDYKRNAIWASARRPCRLPSALGLFSKLFKVYFVPETISLQGIFHHGRFGQGWAEGEDERRRGRWQVPSAEGFRRFLEQFQTDYCKIERFFGFLGFLTVAVSSAEGFRRLLEQFQTVY